MNAIFFQKIEAILHTERIDAYRQDGADAKLTMARYSLNMALSESLYPALQFSEIALRNTIHQALTVRCETDAWYDSPASKLIPWQMNLVSDAKKSLGNFGKTVTPTSMKPPCLVDFGGPFSSWSMMSCSWSPRKIEMMAGGASLAPSR